MPEQDSGYYCSQVLKFADYLTFNMSALHVLAATSSNSQQLGPILGRTSFLEVGLAGAHWQEGWVQSKWERAETPDSPILVSLVIPPLLPNT